MPGLEQGRPAGHRTARADAGRKSAWALLCLLFLLPAAAAAGGSRIGPLPVGYPKVPVQRVKIPAELYQPSSAIPVPDTDRDGVVDGFDNCPDSPAGFAVDATGCARSQLDDDGDGFMNTVDACPGTDPGATSLANGCSATQLGIQAPTEIAPISPPPLPAPESPPAAAAVAKPDQALEPPTPGPGGDADGDGHLAARFGGDDCNDDDFAIYPGAPEIPYNLVDENCNGMADDDDFDQDGYPSSLDPDDTDPRIRAESMAQALSISIDAPTDATVAEPISAADSHYGDADCLGCHTAEATEVHASIHYQWQGPTPDMTNGGAPQGKRAGALDSYAISVLGNWQQCAKCHVGRGLRPEAVASRAQLENINCLACHSEPGLPTARKDCLACHALAGGGDGVKRGDLTLAHGLTADRAFDVHMASSGADLSCSACHTTTGHRIAGRGTDLRPTDLDEPMDCNRCHERPHVSTAINRHLDRVACQSCHIPEYARDAADTEALEVTEVHRTWRRSSTAQAPFRPEARLAGRLMPRYRFWNGSSTSYLLGDVAAVDPETGRLPTSRPDGSNRDPGSKLYPFKYKTAEQPITADTRQLIALDTGVFFATGDAEAAIRQGLANMGLSSETAYQWATTDTFQLITHEVSPASAALNCIDCHASDRIDFRTLGYGLKDPAERLCSRCHAFKKSPGFFATHDRHVQRAGYDCSTCHEFSRP